MQKKKKNQKKKQNKKNKQKNPTISRSHHNIPKMIMDSSKT